MSETKNFEDLFLSECIHEKNSVNRVNILHISDLHENYKYLESLKDWQNKTNSKFDYIFVTGDILSLKYPDNEKLEEIAKSEAKISSIISFLENMCLKVIYLGGNHDPKTLFSNEEISLTVNSKNIHKTFQKITNDLFMFGFGGSVPTISSKNEITSDKFNPFLDIDEETLKKVTFEGYPFQNSFENPDYDLSDKIYKEELISSFEKCKEKIKSENTTKNLKFILLTHNGPFFCQSSIMEYKGKCVYMGSKALGDFISSNKEEILFNVHGHTHSSKGFYSYFNTPVINSGALKNGNFCKIEIKRNYNDEWFISSSDFIDLNN